MAKTTDVLKAFLTKVQTFANGESPSIKVAYPNVDFKPGSSSMWLEARYFPNESETVTWGNQEAHVAIGFLQVLVMYRTGVGQIAASELADKLITAFPKGTVISNVSVRRRPSQAPAVQLDDKAFIPITISYRGLTCWD
jgi:hypothetical protein